ncbi:MAG: hypothetical protein ACJAVK_002800 [Akkermansiaceae bacterium]|jgi:hypothetical protein
MVEEGDKIVPPCVSTEESASTSEEKFAHYNATNQLPSNKFDTGRASPSCLARGIGREDRSPKTTEVDEDSQQVQRRGVFHNQVRLKRKALRIQKRGRLL